MVQCKQLLRQESVSPEGATHHRDQTSPASGDTLARDEDAVVSLQPALEEVVSPRLQLNE
jgi:hypothetical protein